MLNIPYRYFPNYPQVQRYSNRLISKTARRPPRATDNLVARYAPKRSAAKARKAEGEEKKRLYKFRLTQARQNAPLREL